MIGTVKSIIQVVPDKIQFSSHSSKATERLIMLRSGDGRAFEVLSAKLSEGSESKEEKGEGSVEVKKLAKGCWELTVTVVPNSLSEGSTVQMQTSCKGKPKIVIPLSVR